MKTVGVAAALAVALVVAGSALAAGGNKTMLKADPLTGYQEATPAGVSSVAQANWNNLSLLKGTNSTIVADAAGTSEATTATVTWNSNNTWASTGSRGEENNKFTGADKTLMTGYLDSGAATTTTVTITGLPSKLTSAGYDVYVYAIGGVGGKGGGYRIIDANTKAVLKDYVLAQAPTNSTAYVQVPTGLGAKVYGVGNYILFTGLTAQNITIEATTANGLGFGATPRAPVNAVQLVSPSTQTASAATMIAVNF